MGTTIQYQKSSWTRAQASDTQRMKKGGDWIQSIRRQAFCFTLSHLMGTAIQYQRSSSTRAQGSDTQRMKKGSDWIETIIKRHENPRRPPKTRWKNSKKTAAPLKPLKKKVSLIINTTGARNSIRKTYWTSSEGIKHPPPPKTSWARPKNTRRPSKNLIKLEYVGNGHMNP